MSGAVIYTDLDGTLLDHHTYAFDEALETIKALKDRGIPIIPCTSKTRAETVSLMQAMDIHGPMIIENGAAIWVPQDWGLERPTGSDSDADAWCHSFGPSRGMIRRQLAILSIEWGNRYLPVLTPTSPIPPRLMPSCRHSRVVSQHPLARNPSFRSPVQGILDRRLTMS